MYNKFNCTKYKIYLEKLPINWIGYIIRTENIIVKINIYINNK